MGLSNLFFLGEHCFYLFSDLRDIAQDEETKVSIRFFTPLSQLISRLPRLEKLSISCKPSLKITDTEAIQLTNAIGNNMFLKQVQLAIYESSWSRDGLNKLIQGIMYLPSIKEVKITTGEVVYLSNC